MTKESNKILEGLPSLIQHSQNDTTHHKHHIKSFKRCHLLFYIDNKVKLFLFLSIMHFKFNSIKQPATDYSLFAFLYFFS